MIHRHFFSVFAGGTLVWSSLYLVFTLSIDPYGVSPLQMSLPGVNQYKPKRIDIDRLIKPFEVWKFQPNTVFLGTSRIHQSIDPSALDNSRYATAYNASIPASSVDMNASHLREYIRLDPQLHTVIIELFLYNFLGKQQEKAPRTFGEYLQNTASLFLSVDALQAAIATLKYNRDNATPSHQIDRRGGFYYPPGHNPKAGFDYFPQHIWKQKAGVGTELNEAAFESLNEITEIGREAGLDLIFVLTPNHAYDDFYVDFTDTWQVLEDWLLRVSANGNVYSFSQPNTWVYEPVSTSMRYWYDPYHFSQEFGRAMQMALTGLKNDQTPIDFMIRMTPNKVRTHIAARRQAIRRWAAQNPAFVEEFQQSWRLQQRSIQPSAER